MRVADLGCRLNQDVVFLKSQMANEEGSVVSDIHLLSAKLDRVAQHKAQARYMTPVKFQAKRGTCWDFATLSILEQRYRRQGLEAGWLGPLEFVEFSEHAYGVAVIEYCRSEHFSFQIFCLITSVTRQNEAHCPHVYLSSNSTDGGFISWLYFFKPLHDKLAPESVCPYVEDSSTDNECEGYHEYLMVSRPPITLRSFSNLTHQSLLTLLLSRVAAQPPKI